MFVLYINYCNTNIHLRKLRNKFKLAEIANNLKYIVIYDNFSILAPKIGYTWKRYWQKM